MKKKLMILYFYLNNKYGQSFQTEADLRSWQEKKVVKQLIFLRKHSPYFREMLKNETTCTMETLEKIPFMNKGIMMEHFDQLNTKGIQKKQAFEVAMRAEEEREFSPKLNKMTVGLSSGTSGNRGLFLVSDHEQARWAGTMLAKLLPEGILSQEKIAFFLRANSNLYESVGSKTIMFRFFDLLDSFEQHRQSLDGFQPTILVAPPSMLRMLAKKQNSGELCISPKKIISVAEVLEPIDQEYIEKSFQQQVHQVYQCTEGFLATTCIHGTLHLNEDVVYIEKHFLDKEKTRFSPVITDFSRTTQPIVRYQLNDILELKKEPCPCGSFMTAIRQIEGRSDDLFSFEQKEGGTVQVFPDFIRKWMITSSDRIEEYRVIQHQDQTITIQFKADGDEKEIQSLILQTIQTFVRQQKINMPHVVFSPYQMQEKGKKMKRIERK